MSNETIAWKICYTENGQYRTALSEHNSVGDYRAIDPMASSIALCAAPVSAEPVAQYYRKVNGCPATNASDTRCICWHDKGTGPHPDAQVGDIYGGVTLTWRRPKPTAPVAAQPDLTQQTLDDVKAGIPARDAEIEAMRKQIETLQAQLQTPVNVHSNMCRGIIAPITFDMLAHVLGDDAKQEWIAAQAQPLDIRPLEITDGMALAFHHAITDGSIGQQDVDEIKIGLRAAFINVVDSLSRHDQAQQPVSGAGGLPSDAEFGGWAEDLSKLGYEANREGVEAYLRQIFSSRAALAQQDAALHAEVLGMVQMLEVNEWADHCGKSELGQRLEWAVTALQNRIAELTESSSQQDADKEDAERWRHFMRLLDAMGDDDDPDAPGFPARLHAAFQEGSAATIAAIDAARKENSNA